jgi:hypothetical protein
MARKRKHGGSGGAQQRQHRKTRRASVVAWRRKMAWQPAAAAGKTGGIIKRWRRTAASGEAKAYRRGIRQYFETAWRVAMYSRRRWRVRVAPHRRQRQRHLADDSMSWRSSGVAASVETSA